MASDQRSTCPQRLFFKPDVFFFFFKTRDDASLLWISQARCSSARFRASHLHLLRLVDDLVLVLLTTQPHCSDTETVHPTSSFWDKVLRMAWKTDKLLSFITSCTGVLLYPVRDTRRVSFSPNFPSRPCGQDLVSVIQQFIQPGMRIAQRIISV